MNSFDLSTISSSHRDILLSMGKSPSTTTTTHDDDDLMYRFDDDEEDIRDISPQSDTISISSSSNDGSDTEIDTIRQLIETTLGSTDKEEEVQHIHQHPRSKFLGKLGFGATTTQRPVPVPVSIPRTVTATRVISTPRTPPTSPHDTTSDDSSLDAMLALMGVADEMSVPSPVLSIRRSSPINIPMKASSSSSRPIPIRTTRVASRPSPLDSLLRPAQQQHTATVHTSRGWDSRGWDSDDDDDTEYFDSPQCEDITGSMLFDY